MCSLLFYSTFVLALASVALAAPGKIPDHVDWRDVPGVISPVRDQGENCNAGWAFAAAAALESSMTLVFNMTPKALSPQFLIDCDILDFGCSGGTPKEAIAYVTIEKEEDYPYTGRAGTCKSEGSKEILPRSKHVHTYMIGGRRLKYELATKSPFVAMVDASSRSFRNYKSGVYYNPDCENEFKKLNHGVQVIGYGTDPKEGDYWLLKNSWGTDWGENGYMRLSQKSPCGLLTDLATIWKLDDALKGVQSVIKTIEH